MASFTQDDRDRLDYQLVVHCGVTLFHRRAHFEATRECLVSLGYAIHELDVRSGERFAASVTRVLRWKERFGYEPWRGNLDALNDGFGDVACTAADFEGVTGIAFVMRRFDRLAADDPRTASTLLPIIDEASRYAMVEGRRLFAIVQTNDVHHPQEPFVRWNAKEMIVPQRVADVPKRVVILGNSGSGKTTLARALAQEHDLMHLDLDTIVWEPGQVAVRRDTRAVHADLDAFVDAHEAWVIEGAYGELAAYLEPDATELVFLDPGLDTCLAHHRARPFEPHKYATMEAQQAQLANLETWVRSYYTRDDDWSHAAHERVFAAWRRAKSR